MRSGEAFIALDHGGEAAADNGLQPVAKSQHLIEILRNQDDRSPRLARRQQFAMHRGDGPFIEPACRLAGEDQARRGDQVPAKDELLHVAAGEQADARIGRCAAHIEALDDTARMVTHRRAAQEAATLERWLIEPFERGILSHAHLAHHALRVPVLRDAAKTERDAPAWRQGVDRRAIEQQVAGGWRGKPADQPPEGRLPIARNADDAKNLAAAHIKGNIAQPRLAGFDKADATGAEQRRAGLLRLAHGAADAPADHEFGKLRPAGLRRAAFRHGLAATQNHDAVSRRQHLAKLVRNEHQRQPFARHDLERGEEGFGLALGQHGSRLVEDQHARIAVERLKDLHALALADREIADPRIGIDGEPEARGDPEQLRPRLLPARAQAEQRLGTDDDIVEHGEIGGQREMLMHHADARLDRGARLARRQGLAKGPHLTLIGDVMAEQDVHQRRLARTVLAQQRKDFALAEREADRVIGGEAAEALGDAAHFEHRFGHHAAPGAAGVDAARGFPANRQGAAVQIRANRPHQLHGQRQANRIKADGHGERWGAAGIGEGRKGRKHLHPRGKRLGPFEVRRKMTDLRRRTCQHRHQQNVRALAKLPDLMRDSGQPAADLEQLRAGCHHALPPQWPR